MMSKSRLKRLEAQFANSLYVCGGCGKNVPENVPCPFCAAAPSPPASARERCLETVADAMTVAVGYVEAMREHPPDAAVIVNLRGLLENARTVLRSALDTERGKK